MDNLTTLRYKVANSTIGFDHLVDFFTKDNHTSTQASYPPYNIVKINDLTYRIELAVAGFALENLDISVQENVLTITGKKDAEQNVYLHKGIAARDFQSKFTIADDVMVLDASVLNGLLSIVLERKIPDHKKPKQVIIRDTSKQLLTE